jgi:hypothetical protein
MYWRESNEMLMHKDFEGCCSGFLKVNVLHVANE